MLLLMEMIKTNCVQCLYHWHRPLELMNQVTSSIYCSADDGLSLHNYEVTNLHVRGIGEAYCKGSSVTLLR